MDLIKENPEIESVKLSFTWMNNRDLKEEAKVTAVKTLIQLRVNEVKNYIEQLYFITDVYEYFKNLNHGNPNIQRGKILALINFVFWRFS